MKQRLISFWKSLPPRGRKRAAWVAGLLLFYTVFGFLILPWIVKLVAVHQLSRQLDRETTIRQVRINPFVLSGTIRGLLVKDKDGQPFLSLEEGYGNFQLISFFGKPWVFKELRAVQPYCRVQINKDYSFNFSDLIKKFSHASPTPPKPSKPLFLHIDRLQIVGAGASFTDLTPSTPFKRLIGPVQIALTNFQTDPYNENPYSFLGTTDSGEKFAWSGQFSLVPLQSSGELSLEGLSIPKYAPLYQDLVRFDLKDGIVSGRAAYRVTLTESNYLATITNASGSLSSLKVTERGGSEDLIELDQLAVSGVAADTSARTAEIAAIAISGGRLAARRNSDNTINLVELSEPAPKATNAPGGILFLMQAATNALAALIRSTNLWSGTIHQLEVTNCAVLWEDLAGARKVHLAVDQIAFLGQHLSNVAGTNQTAFVSIRWNTNGTAQAAATVQISPPAAEVSLNVANLELQPLGPYLDQFVNLFLLDSKVGVDGRLEIQMASNGLPEVTFRGDARLDDFVTVDRESDDLLKWKSVQVTGLDANLQPPAIAIKEVAVVEPLVRVAFDTQHNLNFLAVLKTNTAAAPGTVAPQAAAEAPGATSKKMSFAQKLGSILRQILEEQTNSAGQSALPKATVDIISITNGVVQFNDRSVEPPVAMTIQDLNGDIRGVSTEKLNRADLRFMARASRTGPIEITGKINPLNQDAPTELTVTIHNVDLSPTSPYTGKFLGYRLNRGRLGVQASYVVTQRQLKATNAVVLDQFTLGDKVQSPDATKLPVKLAIALLKDRNGRIEVNLPIDGSLDDPQFRIGTVIVHVLVHVVTKIVTSPFAALGALFGGRGEEISYQDFAPGSARLEAANVQKLNDLITALYERPGLELQIEGSFEPNADGEALRRLKLERGFRQQKWTALPKAQQDHISPEDVALTPTEYAAFVQASYVSALRSGAATNIAVSARSAAAPPPPQNIQAEPEEHGATMLMARPVAPPPTVQVIDKERIVLSTIRLSDNELFQLASDRARNVRQHILDSGKVEAERLSLVEIGAGGTTNRASRVFFHLE